MRRRRVLLFKILFHTASLLSLILATTSAAMLIQSNWESERWVHTTSSHESAAIPLTHATIWELECAGYVVRLARTTLHSTPLDMSQPHPSQR
jgi:hypothetical protein